MKWNVGGVMNRAKVTRQGYIEDRKTSMLLRSLIPRGLLDLLHAPVVTAVASTSVCVGVVMTVHHVVPAPAPALAGLAAAPTLARLAATAATLAGLAPAGRLAGLAVAAVAFVVVVAVS